MCQQILFESRRCVSVGVFDFYARCRDGCRSECFGHRRRIEPDVIMDGIRMDARHLLTRVPGCRNSSPAFRTGLRCSVRVFGLSRVFGVVGFYSSSGLSGSFRSTTQTRQTTRTRQTGLKCWRTVPRPLSHPKSRLQRGR